jgi:flagellar hook protein FlgE
MLLTECRVKETGGIMREGTRNRVQRYHFCEVRCQASERQVRGARHTTEGDHHSVHDGRHEDVTELWPIHQKLQDTILTSLTYPDTNGTTCSQCATTTDEETCTNGTADGNLTSCVSIEDSGVKPG